ncbi:MAG: ABC transporter permease [Bacteroidales bacterium]|nr:ABC transporter permease [Bacteroidales bacterium]
MNQFHTITAFIKQWLKDFWGICCHEWKLIVHDGGVLIIFTIGALGYPLLYNLMYKNGVLEDVAIAVVDNADCSESRRYIREVDATRELEVAYRCATMAEAERLFQQRKVNGIIYFPKDFGERLARMETATLSIYADMSSFLYYKNLMMGSHFVMLHEIGEIQIERYAAAGFTEEQSMQLVSAIPYEENNPYNRTFSYTIFFLSAALLMVVQQTMFYGMTMLAGTQREEHHSFALLPSHLEGVGIGRVVLGRGFAYGLLYLAIGMYIAFIVPAIFDFPQRGGFWDILVLLLFFITDCVFFCSTWSSFITRRETVFILLLVMSPVAMFLTGFSWPTSSFPFVWKCFSYLLPSTFGCQAFINLNTAGGDLTTVRPQIIAMTVQGAIYYLTASLAVYAENRFIRSERVQRVKAKRKELLRRLKVEI